MRIFFRVYPKSLLATLCSLGGMLCLALGIGGAVNDISDKKYGDLVLWIILAVLGVAIFISADKVNKVVVKRKMKKSLEDEKLIAYIQQSTLAAYSLFKNDPTDAMLSYIYGYNPYAANVIKQYITYAITEDVLINVLREYDTQNGSIGIWDEKKSSLYHNNMFTLMRVVSSSDPNHALVVKQAKKEETKKGFAIVGGCLLVGIIIAVIIVAVSSGSKEKLCEHTYESKVVIEATYYSEGKVNKRCTKCYDEVVETIPKLESPIQLDFLSMETYEEEKPALDMGDGTEVPMISDYWIVFEMDAENVGEEDIESFSGYIVVTSGDYETRIFMLFEEEIDAGETVRLSDYGMRVSFTDNDMSDNMLIGKTIDDVEITFEPANFEFE